MSCLPVLTIAAQTVSDSIPFELGADNRIYLRCRVNDSNTLRFLLDTGATDMVMNPNAPRSNYTMNFDSEVTNSGATGVNQIRSSISATMTCFLDAHLMKTRWSSHSPEMVISEKHVASKIII